MTVPKKRPKAVDVAAVTIINGRRVLSVPVAISGIRAPQRTATSESAHETKE